MDNPTQFVVIAKRILQELRTLNEAITIGIKRVTEKIDALGSEGERIRHKDELIRVRTEVVSFEDSLVRERRLDQDRQHRTQNSIKKATWLTFIAVFLYAGVTALQWREMKKATENAGIAAEAAKYQVETMRQQLIATQAAVLTLTPRPIGAMNVGSNDFLVSLQNNSHAIASRIRAKLRILKVQDSDQKTLWESEPIIIEADQLLPTEQGHNTIDRMYPFLLSASEKDMFENTALTFGVSGSIEYWNGFEATETSVCIIELRYTFKDKSGKLVVSGDSGFVPCEEFRAVIPSIEKTKKEWEQSYR